VCPPAQIRVENVLSRNKIRCVLVHDHVLLRQGLRRLLEDEPDLEVVSEAGNAAEAISRVFDCRPDVVIAEASTLGLPAPEAERLLQRESPHTKVLFLSMPDQETLPFGEIHEASWTCTVRQTSSDDLVKMVRRACQNDAENSPKPVTTSGEVTGGEIRGSSEELFSRKRPLTAREREVLKLLAEGRTVRATAMLLGLSIKTVDAHKFNLMRKLGIHNKAELVMWAIQRRVVKVPVNF
jgi:two-component system response regulator NreC